MDVNAKAEDTLHICEPFKDAPMYEAGVGEPIHILKTFGESKRNNKDLKQSMHYSPLKLLSNEKPTGFDSHGTVTYNGRANDFLWPYTSSSSSLRTKLFASGSSATLSSTSEFGFPGSDDPFSVSSLTHSFAGSGDTDDTDDDKGAAHTSSSLVLKSTLSITAAEAKANAETALKAAADTKAKTDAISKAVADLVQADSVGKVKSKAKAVASKSIPPTFPPNGVSYPSSASSSTSTSNSQSSPVTQRTTRSQSSPKKEDKKSDVDEAKEPDDEQQEENEDDEESNGDEEEHSPSVTEPKPLHKFEGKQSMFDDMFRTYDTVKVARGPGRKHHINWLVSGVYQAKGTPRARTGDRNYIVL